MADYKGLKMRIPGLGGKVVARAGATVVTLPASEIYGALERGVIDTSEYLGPHDDMILGLHKTARRTMRSRLICSGCSTMLPRPSKSTA